MTVSEHHLSIIVAHFMRTNQNTTHLSESELDRISRTCWGYLNDWHKWTLQGEDFTNLVHAAPGTVFVSPPINYYSLIFRTMLYPNGLSRDTEGFGSIIFAVNHFPQYILGVYILCTVYLENRCIIQQSFDLDQQNPSHMLTSPDIPSFDISEYAEPQKVTLSTRVSVIDFEYAPPPYNERFDNRLVLDYQSKYFSPYESPALSTYQWTLDETILRDLSQSKTNLFCFDALPDYNWTLSVESKGSECYLCWTLLRCPRQVANMDLRIRWRLNQLVHVANVRNVSRYGTSKLSIDLSDWWQYKASLTAVTVKMEISLLRAFDSSGNLLYEDALSETRFIRDLVDC